MASLREERDKLQVTLSGTGFKVACVAKLKAASSTDWRCHIRRNVYFGQILTKVVWPRLHDVKTGPILAGAGTT